jgi:hypothetical protein
MIVAGFFVLVDLVEIKVNRATRVSARVMKQYVIEENKHV